MTQATSHAETPPSSRCSISDSARVVAGRSCRTAHVIQYTVNNVSLPRPIIHSLFPIPPPPPPPPVVHQWYKDPHKSHTTAPSSIAPLVLSLDSRIRALDMPHTRSNPPCLFLKCIKTPPQAALTLGVIICLPAESNQHCCSSHIYSHCLPVGSNQWCCRSHMDSHCSRLGVGAPGPGTGWRWGRWCRPPPHMSLYDSWCRCHMGQSRGPRVQPVPMLTISAMYRCRATYSNAGHINISIILLQEMLRPGVSQTV